MKLYAVVHLHAWGHTVYLVKSDHEPTEDEIVDKVLETEYEEDKGESLLVDEVDIEQAVTI